MTNLLTVLPDFDIHAYTHILPSLEKALISTADLLTLDALDVAKRAQVPPGEVKKLASALIDGLHAPLPTASDGEHVAYGDGAFSGLECGTASRPRLISTLDDELDLALCGGIATGKVTEFVGESAAGKTQFLLTLLLSVQLDTPEGSPKSALYVSTEAPLQTSRLAQILESHPKLAALAEAERPSMARVQSAHIHDVEAQEHILRYQVPVVIKRHNVGLLVVDSIAANFRAESDRGKAQRSAAESSVKRNNQVTQLGALLREIAETYGIAVVVANQVSDRFTAADNAASQIPQSQQKQKARPTSPPYSTMSLPPTKPQTPAEEQAIEPPCLSTDDPLSLDHQQLFMTGWGDDPITTNLKTPSLGLAWTNQIATRIALLKAPIYEVKQYRPGEEPNVVGWRRTLRVVFSSWCPATSTEFEIGKAGVRAVVEHHEGRD